MTTIDSVGNKPAYLIYIKNKKLGYLGSCSPYHSLQNEQCVNLKKDEVIVNNFGKG